MLYFDDSAVLLAFASVGSAFLKIFSACKDFASMGVVSYAPETENKRLERRKQGMQESHYKKRKR